MQISKDTIDILKNFASVNSNILIRKGKTLSTISTAKSIFAKAIVAEDFPEEVAIYDLNSLLALLTLMENQNIEFGDKSLTVSKDNGKFEYFYSNQNVIVSAPNKTIELDEHFKFSLTDTEIGMIMKAAAITAAPIISVISKDGKVTLVVGDNKNETANSYRRNIGDNDDEFECHIAVENFKIIPAAYDVTISKKKFMHFKNNVKNIEYFIAMEPNSVV